VTLAQLETQIADQTDSPMLDDDFVNFLTNSESMAAMSGDLLSGAPSDLTELRYETHQQAQNTLYAAADSLCHSITYYKNKSSSLEETYMMLEKQQQEAEKQAKKTAEEMPGLQQEKRTLEKTLKTPGEDPVRH
jgi:chromosome segregation ATPase